MVKSSGNDKTLERVNRDLKELYNGVKVITANGEKSTGQLCLCVETLGLTLSACDPKEKFDVLPGTYSENSRSTNS